MGKIGNSITGMAVSATVAAGAYGAEIYTENLHREAIIECIELFEDDKDRSQCIDSVNSTYNKAAGLHILQFTGLVGIIGFGYNGYKVVKEEDGQ